jgi:hypothetical protein
MNALISILKSNTFILIFALLFSYPAISQNIDISGGLVFEGEPYLVIDPANSQHLVVEWMGYTYGHWLNLSMKTKATFNGGKTWSNAINFPHQHVSWKSADPSMVMDKNGNIIACYIDYLENPDSGGVYIIKSFDGGLSWTGASKVIDALADGNKIPIDRPWLTIDNSNASSQGNLYVTTKPPSWVPAPNRPYFLKSTDGGSTWSHFRYVDTTGYLVGNYIQAPMAMSAVSSNGVLHIIYPSWNISQNLLPGFYIATSEDAGNTFTHKPVAFMNTSGTDSLAKAGYCLFSDPSDPNHLAFVFPAKTYGDLDVFFIESRDNGNSWDSPLRINDDAIGNGKMQDLVWGDFNSNGDIILTWRDRRNATGIGYEIPSEIYAAVRWKDSVKFSANFKISDTLAPYNSILSDAGNDFMSVCLSHDTLLAAWGDVRNGRLNIWFEKRNIKTNISSGLQTIVSEEIPEINAFPNPAKDYVFFEGKGIKEVIMYDLTGNKVLSQNGQKINITNLKPGEYTAHIISKTGIVDKKFIKY